MINYVNSTEEDLTNLKEKIKSILQKLQIQTVVEKGEELFLALEPG